MNMKKKVLATAVVAAMGVGSAHAVSLSTDGTGEVAIVPYWTTMPGMANPGDKNDYMKTNVSIVNTTSETKAVKVRFIEAENSREVLDFNLYLSPEDVWTASLMYFDTAADKTMYAAEWAAGVLGEPVSGSVSGTRIITNDNSCTAPDISTNSYAFSNVLFTDGGTTGANRLRSGYFEVIEMGVVVDAQAVAAIKHTAAGVPGNCAAVRAANMATFAGVGDGFWDTAPYASDLMPDVVAPTGGLMVNASLIHVNDGTEISVPVTHLEGFRNLEQHTKPEDLLPNLASVLPAISIVTDNNAPDSGLNVWVDEWLYTVTNKLSDDNADAVSAVLMTESVSNEYTINTAVGAETSWVITFPTKRFYLDENVTPLEPFTKLFTAGRACESAAYMLKDREEAAEESILQPSPQVGPSATRLNLCYEANVVNFNESDVLYSPIAASLTGIPYANGWAKLTFDLDGHELHNQITGRVYQGLPAIGFRASVLKNPNAGQGAYYGTSVPHAYERGVVGSRSTFPIWNDTNKNGKIDTGEQTVGTVTDLSPMADLAVSGDGSIGAVQ